MAAQPSMQIEAPEVIGALQDFGLSEPEVAVYQALLALGPRPASIIAQRTGLKRGHTYNLLKNLMEMGIAQEFLKNSIRNFTVSPPSSLVSMLELRADDLERKKQKLRKIVPELERLRDPMRRDPRVRFFRGVDGIKEIYEDMLRYPEQDIRTVLDANYSWSVSGGEPEEWLVSFIKRRIERDIWWRAIINRSERSDAAVRGRPNVKREIKMVEELTLTVEICVYASKVAMLSTGDEMSGVMIENEMVAESLRNLHQAVWPFLPDYPLE
jgi:sugar-specific transcriptional regulator TrmB